MRVTAVEATAVRATLPEPLYDARSALLSRGAVVVRVATEDPLITGWGEAACFGGVEAPVLAFVDHFASRVVGRDLEPRSVAQDLLTVSAHYAGGGALAAISGIEIALWDALGKWADLPVCSLLGVTPAKVPTYRTLGFYVGPDSKSSLESLRREIGGRANQSEGVKVKIGRFGLADDVARIQLAREILGTEHTLIVDANNAYDLVSAKSLFRAIAGLDVAFVEEPIAFGDPIMSAELRAAVATPLAGYELDADYRGCRSYIEARAVDYVQPDAIWSGGIGECLAIAELARHSGIETIPHNFSTPIGTAANYHVASVVGSPLLELDGTGSPLGDSALQSEGWAYENGRLQMLQGSGLGVPDPCSWLDGIADD